MKQINTKARSAKIQNHTLTCRGRLIIESEDNIHTFGFEDLQYWHPVQHTWILLSADNDKFKIMHEDPEIARSEFWGRWRIYTQKRFGINFIRIEQSTTFEIPLLRPIEPARKTDALTA